MIKRKGKMARIEVPQEPGGGIQKQACGCAPPPVFPVIPPCGSADAPCCGPPAGARSSPYERPGYRLCRFVEGFVDTPSGPVPRVATRWDRSDVWITLAARIGIRRNRYRIAPGLYAVGAPDADAPVLVTANYRLSFNALRRELSGLNVWILVLDTRGINVWCAAGKGTFDSREIIRQVNLSGLGKVVSHLKLILPQLSAPGVDAAEVKQACGFKAVWGPIRATDIARFLVAGMKAEPPMRRATFTLAERLVLVPVEVTLLRKPTLWMVLSIFLLSGIGPHLFSPNPTWSRALQALAAYGAGVVSGALLVPALLPWLPGKAFALKGALTGLAGGAAMLWLYARSLGSLECFALLMLSMAVSSYLAMNFTGATPFTSPSGVEKEMRRAIPLQAGALFLAATAWVGSAYLG